MTWLISPMAISRLLAQLLVACLSVFNSPLHSTLIRSWNLPSAISLSTRFDALIEVCSASKSELNATAQRPISSFDEIGARSEKSPSFSTRRIVAMSSWTGCVSERAKKIATATIKAIATAKIPNSTFLNNVTAEKASLSSISASSAQLLPRTLILR